MIRLRAKAYIFDFDGTMMHTLPLWRELDELYLARHNILMPPDLQKAIEGMNFVDCAAYFQKRFGITDSIEEITGEWLSIIHEQIVSHPLKEDVVRFLDQTDKPLAIATSNNQLIIEDVLRVNQLSARFPVIVTSDEVGRSKPDPAVFLEAAKRLGIAPQDCVVFEDTEAGVQGAKRAKMTAIAVYDPSNPVWEITAQQADFSLVSFDEIVEV